MLVAEEPQRDLAVHQKPELEVALRTHLSGEHQRSHLKEQPQTSLSLVVLEVELVIVVVQWWMHQKQVLKIQRQTRLESQGPRVKKESVLVSAEIDLE